MTIDMISQLFGMHLFDVSRLSSAIAAIIPILILGVFIGPLRNNCYSAIWIIFETFLGSIGQRLDRQNRKQRDLFLRGFFFTMAAGILGLGLGSFLIDLAKISLLAEITLVALCLSGGTVLHSQFRLFKALKKKKTLQGSYLTISKSSRNNLNSSDDYGITRIGMGLTASCFCKAMVAPIFWYFVAGLPALYFYTVISMLVWRFGREGNSKGFGRTAQFIDHIMGYFPDLIAGFLISIAGLFTPTGAMTRALFGQLFGKERAPYSQGGKTMTALAYSLKVNLGGPSVDLDGVKIERQWIGPQGTTAKLNADHLRRAMYVGLVSHILLIAMIVSVIMWMNILS